MPKLRSTLVSLTVLGLLTFAACTDDADPPATEDTADSGVLDTVDTGDTSNGDDTDDAIVGPTRDYSHRGIGGISMGAAAATIALHNPDMFDIVGALGGYANTRYMAHQMSRLQLAGFCPLATLEALDLSDPDILDGPEADCGLAPALFELEVPQRFNAYHYDTNGITMTRGFYARIIQMFSSIYGNLAVPEHAENPALAAGVDAMWSRDAVARTVCAGALPPVSDRYKFNAEYNPEGLYDVIPVCDIEEPGNALLLPSVLDAMTPRNLIIRPLLALDINGNGMRELGEPIILNGWERFDDVGADGCANDREDGSGGCVEAAAMDMAVAADPNGDDFHWLDGPAGLEGNGFYDVGEPFRDLGLDGVAEAVAGFADNGEENGVWDTTIGYGFAQASDVGYLIAKADAAALDRMDFWFDAGIRDALHAAPATRQLVAALTARGQTVSRYVGFGGREGTLTPEIAAGAFLGAVFNLDLSEAAIGRHVYIEYGDPNADADAIEDGDGKHVGSSLQVVNRLSAFLTGAIQRLPDPDLEEGFRIPSPASVSSHFYSEGLKARRNYTITFPAGYAEPEAAETRYPTMYILHGLGQSASDLAPAGTIVSALMSQGRIAKTLLVFPDGKCCFRNAMTGAHECACGDAFDGDQGRVRACVEPSCEGAPETCATREIADSMLVEECLVGSLYANVRADRWGNLRDDMGYEDSVTDLVEHIDQSYRTRSQPAE
ncbi:MAG: hypothetical protein ACI9MR_000617 [Myxococcota bacterium]